MEMALMLDNFGNSLEDNLSLAQKYGYRALEIPTGNWCESPAVDIDNLLNSKVSRDKLTEQLRKKDMHICALNCSGNQLAPNEKGKRHAEVVDKTFRLAEILSVKKVVMMSGLPGGCKEDRCPNWVTASWPRETQSMLEYQWETAAKYWEKAVKRAQDCGIEKVALENHGYQLVYNTDTMLKLRGLVGKTVGMNLDPSHMFWMGGDPILMLRALGSAVYHIHAKDVRIERHLSGINGLLETKFITRFAERSWNYVALGYGHDELWWKEFFSVANMIGYDGEVALELEDASMDIPTALEKSTKILKAALPK